MAKRQRWLIRIALEIDGGLTTANKVYDEVPEIVAELEAAGYVVYEYRAAIGPRAAVGRSPNLEAGVVGGRLEEVVVSAAGERGAEKRDGKAAA